MEGVSHTFMTYTKRQKDVKRQIIINDTIIRIWNKKVKKSFSSTLKNANNLLKHQENIFEKLKNFSNAYIEFILLAKPFSGRTILSSLRIKTFCLMQFYSWKCENWEERKKFLKKLINAVKKRTKNLII